jgi:hypothetical protein
MDITNVNVDCNDGNDGNDGNDVDYDFDFDSEYDLLDGNDTCIMSSIDNQNDILNLVKLSNNHCLHTLTLNQILKNPHCLSIYKEFETLARNIFNYTDGNPNHIYLSLMIKLIKHMRWEHGLNKRLLSYCLLDILSEHNVNLANELFLNFTTIGSWKDLKYFYMFCSLIGKEFTSSVIDYSIQLANEQLKKDLLNYTNKHTNTATDTPTNTNTNTNTTTSISNIAKWIPREKSKYKKLYERLVIDYFKDTNYFKYTDNWEQKKKAMNKAKMEYRKILSKLNNELDTVQIKQCAKNWQKIDPQKQTITTLKLQSKAFLNLSRNSNLMRYELSDRIICSQNFVDSEVSMNRDINRNKRHSRQTPYIKNTQINSFKELISTLSVS